MSDCLFCRLVAGEIPATVVRESPDTLAFRDIAPQAPVHVVVVPKQHYVDIAELIEADIDLAATLLREATRVAVAQGLPEKGYRLVFNTGPDAGQTVPHVHLHILGGVRLAKLG